MHRFYALVGFVLPVTARLASTGASFNLNGTYYYVPPFSIGKAYDGTLSISDLQQAFGLTPVTIVSNEHAAYVTDHDYMSQLFANWSTVDDVWQPSFLSTILFGGLNRSSCSTKASYHSELESSVVRLHSNSTSGTIPSGPYFLDIATGQVHQAYRLYDDFSGAFTAAVFRHPTDDKFYPLSAQMPTTASITLGVHRVCVRIAVKDLYDLAGIKKSNGNRAWWHLYPESKKTAVPIQNLIDAGAVVVGTQKMSQFANGATPTADWVDYHGPFNPRGDGYNDPSSSSADASSGASSYDWLDICVGSDTGGSVRWPAAAVGVFGNRPSHGLVHLEGVMPMSPALDTPGFLLRDPSLWDDANRAMFGANYTSLKSLAKPSYPNEILTMGFPNTSTPDGQILHDFSSKLAKFIGDDTKEQVPLVRELFFKDYAAAHEGRIPFLDPTSKVRWDWGLAAPSSWLDDARRNKTLFSEWWTSKVQPHSDDVARCTSNLVLYPGAVGTTPSPRNAYLKAPGPPLGWFTALISCFAESPDSVFPLGEIAVPSTITGRDEMLPITVDVIAAKGCDGVLARLAMDLVDAGILRKPMAGRTLGGGEVLFR